MDRLEELNKKRESTGLTALESKEFEILFNSHQQAETDPRVQAAREQNRRLRQQVANPQPSPEYVWGQIFRTVVKGKTAMDNLANRGIITRWVQGETENVQDVQQWFNKHCSENPAARAELAWTEYRTPQQVKADRDKVAQVRREQAILKTRQFGLSECQSNLDILADNDGDVIWTAQGPSLWSDNGEMVLVPATQAELQKYAQEKQDRHQGYLRQLSAKNDIAGLRAASAVERQEKITTTQNLFRDYGMLKNFAQRQEYLLTPLPATWNGKVLDADFIRHNSRREILGPMISKHGGERVNARLFGLDESFFNDWANKLRVLEAQVLNAQRF